LDGRALTFQPWFVRTKDEVNDLYSLMISKGRRASICAFSLQGESEDQTAAAASAASVHHRTLGGAHVVILTGPAAFMLTDLVGKEFSVFNRAVRTYYPGFDTDMDDPLRHPIAMAHRIAVWQDDWFRGPEGFENFLVRTLIVQTVTASDLEDRLPPFSAVRRAATTISLQSAQESGASKDELLRLYEEDSDMLRLALTDEKELHSSLLTEADREREEAQRRAEEAKGEVHRLNQRIRMLEGQLKAKGDVDFGLQLPEGLDDLKTWADNHLSGSVFITNRALRGAKASDFEDPTLVYKALLLLRDQYVPLRRGGGEQLARHYADALRSLGLEEAPSITATRLGEHRDEYKIQHNGRKRDLDRHLKKGNSRESRHCFRLYFFWDEDDEQVVVGWLTSHLDTRQT
jgi:hypothetical protein